MCGVDVVDVTTGCSFGCVYCPFAEIAQRRGNLHRPTLGDLGEVLGQPAPRKIYLSASSDAFAPQAAARTHALLSRWLPRGTIVGIVTKGVVPEQSADLLARFRRQVEGISVGLSSLDDRRNRAIEPGCPPASDRLDGLERLARRGLPVVLRMDPLFPDLDDGREGLADLIGEAGKRGARGIAAGYVFAWGRYLRRIRRQPLLADSSRHLTERAPMAGGTAWSVPLRRKLDLYHYLANVAAGRGLHFQTCGCKDLRLHASEKAFQTQCTVNPFRAEHCEVTRTRRPIVPDA